MDKIRDKRTLYTTAIVVSDDVPGCAPGTVVAVLAYNEIIDSYTIRCAPGTPSYLVPADALTQCVL